MVTPLCHENKNSISDTTDNFFISSDQAIMNKKDQGGKERLVISRFYLSDESNYMGHSSKMLIYDDEGSNKVSKPDHTNKISLVTPKETFSGMPNSS